jgi:hypothetical protein
MWRPLNQEEWDEVAAASGYRWLEPVKTGNKPHQAICLTCGLESKPWPSAMKRTGSKCKWCRNRQTTQKEWDRRIALSQMEWLEPVIDGRIEHMARCLVCGYEYKVAPATFRPKKGKKPSKCRRCSGKVVFDEEWLERAKSVEIHLLEPVINTRTEVKARCLRCQTIFEANPQSIAKGNGHGDCKRVSAHEFDLRAARVGLEWVDPPEKVTQHCRARCLDCGHVWPVLPSAISEGSACPECARYGIKLREPGLLYLIRRGWILKVGITNAIDPDQSERLKRHKRSGFEVEASWLFTVAQTARDIEQATISWWRDELGLPALEIDGKRSKETVDVRQVSIQRVVDYIESQMRGC